MVEYAYRDLFYKSQQTKDILIVDTEAVVTINPGGAPMVENATVEIHTADIKINTFTLDESLCSEEDLTWGLMESAEVRFTIKNTRRIPNLKNTDYSKMVNIYIYFNNNSSTLFQVGQYICDSDKYSSDRRFRNIVLYDALYYLRSWDITEWYNNIYADNEDAPISVYDLRFSLFDYMFTEFDYPIEQNEETELVNDDYLVPKNIESDTITFDFFMGGILNANGVFGHMGRTGLFEYITLVKYDAPTVTTVTDDFRKPPTTYEDFAVWGIGYVRVYDQNNMELAYQGSSAYRHPSVYNIVDNFVLTGIKSITDGEENVKQATRNIREQVTHRRYAPMNVEHVGDLCIEVGDNVAVTGDIGNYNTYVLERHLKGLGTMLDRYISRGNRKQPKYKINDNWHIGDSQDTSTYGTSGVSSVNDTLATDLIKYWRNIGIRLLKEPDNVSVEYNRESGEVEIMWTDPENITSYAPVPVDWAGTIVVRKEGGIPYHRWDGTVLVNSTTRDEYSEEPFIDDTVEENKKYYYGIFPYHVHLDDADHPIKYYRFTKVVSVNTQSILLAPLIISHSVNGTRVTLTFSIPELSVGSYSYIKVVAKKNGIPANKTDGIVKDVAASDTSVIFDGLDSQSKYYFMIFANDGSTDTESDPDDCVTGITPIVMEYGNGNQTLGFEFAITSSGVIVPFALISANGITYSGVSYRKSAYYIDTEDVTDSEVCLIGNSGLLSQIRKSDSTLTTTYNPVANNETEYLYKSKVVSTKFNISKPAIPVFLRSADYNKFIKGGIVLRSVYSEYLNKHFSHPNDVPSWWEECPDGKAYYEYTVPSGKTMTAMLIIIGANTAEYQQKDFYVEFRRTKDGEAFKTEHFYFQSPYGSPCEQFFIDELSLTGTMWIVVYDNRTGGWLPLWRDVFIELEGETQTVTLDSVMKQKDFANYTLDLRDPGTGSTGLNAIPSEYVGSNYVFSLGQHYGEQSLYDAANQMLYADVGSMTQYIGNNTLIPIQHCTIAKMKFDLVFNQTYDHNWFRIRLYRIENGAVVVGDLVYETAYSVDITNHVVDLGGVEADYIGISNGSSSSSRIFELNNVTLEVI